MAIQKMQFIRLTTDKSHMDEMLHTALESRLISAESTTALIASHVKGDPIQEINYFEEDINVLQGYANLLGISLDASSGCAHEYTKEEIDTKLKQWEEAFACFNTASKGNLSVEDEAALDLIRPLNYSDLHSLRYIDIRFGRLPVESIKKLSVLDQEAFIYEVVQQNERYAWVLIGTSDGYYRKTIEILQSLFFENIEIPLVDRKAYAEKYRDELNDVYAYCLLGSSKTKLHAYILKDDEDYNLYGFVAESDLDHFKSLFDGNVKIESVDGYDTIKKPTRLKNSWFFRPFEMFVKMYSLPDYTEIDPTPFLAVTYCLLFGIMFGDLGQGALLFIGGLLLEKKTGNQLAGIVGRCGIFAMIFGFLFGSVFGNEEILVPVHQSLFNVEHLLFETMNSANTMTLLIGAIAIGVLLTLICQSMNIFIKFKQGHKAEAIYGQNGIAGLVFFAYVLLFVLKFMGMINVPVLFDMPVCLIFILVPIICFFLKERFEAVEHGESFKPKAGWGNYALEAFFECFEVVLSFITNTMSYLRVGGFVLSHAGMMLVVMTLMDMVGGASPLVFVIGNLFVMALEGLIVGIQTLRLEYYEMFSRYFVGGGKQFTVMSVD